MELIKLLQEKNYKEANTLIETCGQTLDVNYKDRDGFNAFMNSVAYGCTDIVVFLYTKKFNLDYRNNYIRAFTLATFWGHIDIVNFFLSNDIVPVDSKDYRDNSALYHAAFNGHDKIVDALLCKNASIDITNFRQNTALMEAICYKQKKTAFSLIICGASLDIKNEEGLRAIDYSSRVYCYEIMNFLLLNGSKSINWLHMF